MNESKKGSICGLGTRERFDNYPNIENAATIKGLLTDMLNPQEAKRANAKLIQDKYKDWLSGNF